MAERKQQARVTRPGTVELMVDFTIGASGAVTAFRGPMVTDVSKSATGKYTITMDRGFARYLQTSGEVIRASGARLFPGVDGSAQYSAGASTIVIRTDIQDGTATEPSSGDIVSVTIRFDELGIVP